MGFASPLAPNVRRTNFTATATVLLPDAVLPGDQVWVFIATGSSPAVDFTPPAGYTVVGASVNGAAQWGGRFGIYRHTFAVGDPTSVVFGAGATPTWGVILVRADGAISIQTDASGTGTSNPVVFPAFSPAVVASDMRLAFVLAQQNVGTITPPSVTPNDNNPSGQLFQKVADFGNSGVGYTALLYVSHWDTAADSAPSNWTHVVGKLYYARSITLTDGGTRNGNNEVDLVDEGFLVDPAIGIYSIQEGEDTLSAAAGVFGGGAELV